MDILINLIKAFLVGGGICLIGQLLIDYTKLTPARILTGFVVAGVVLSAVGLYGPLADFAGAGATVPLCGFGHLLAEGVKRSVNELGLIGALGGGISAAGVGIGAAVTFGLIAAFIFNSKDKN